MQPSIFNVRVPLADANDVFLMNTFTDAQLIVSRDVAELLDRIGRGDRRRRPTTNARRSTTLAENGFIVESREADRRKLRRVLHESARARISCASPC